MPHFFRHKRLGFFEICFGDVITVTHPLTKRIDLIRNGYTQRLRGIRFWG